MIMLDKSQIKEEKIFIERKISSMNQDIQNLQIAIENLKKERLILTAKHLQFEMQLLFDVNTKKEKENE